MSISSSHTLPFILMNDSTNLAVFSFKVGGQLICGSEDFPLSAAAAVRPSQLYMQQLDCLKHRNIQYVAFCGASCFQVKISYLSI